MKVFIMLLFFSFSVSYAGAQGTELPKVKYFSYVYLHDSKAPLKGAIVTTGDSTISFVEKSVLKNKSFITPDLIQVIPSTSISSIKTRRKNSAGRGAIRGLLFGAAFGAINGYTTTGNNDFFSPGETATIAAVLFSVPGLVVGTIVGANLKKTIRINGNQASYTLYREKVKKYTLTGN